MNERLEKLENGGVVSQSGPRGIEDGTVTKSRQQENAGGMWGGMFGSASDKATAKV